MSAVDENGPASSRPKRPPPKKRRWRNLIWWSGGLVLVVVGALLLALTVLFPSELVRQELEIRLADLLKGPVRIESLSFNVLYGLELQHVDIHQQDRPLVKFDRLNLDYNLLALLKQEIQLNEILIDGATVFLDLEAMAGAPAEEKPVEPPPEPSPSTGPPALPVSVHLDSLEIRHADLMVVVHPALSVAITDLNVALSGQVTPDHVAATGKVHIEQMDLALEEKRMQLPLDLHLDIQTDLATQQFQLQELRVQFANMIQMNLSGQVDQFFDTPVLDISLHETRLDLPQVLTLLSDFLPPNLKEIQVQGEVAPEVLVQGQLFPEGFKGAVTVNLGIQGLGADLPSFDTTVQDLNLALRLPKMAISENVPEFGEVTMSLTSGNVVYQDYGVSDFHLDVSGDYIALGPVSASVHVAGLSSVPPMDPLPAQNVPFDVKLEAMGNYQLQEWELEQFVVTLEDLLKVEANGHLQPVGSPPEAFKMAFATRIEPNLTGLLSRVPEELVSGIGLTKEGPPDAVTLKLKGRLDPQYQPRQADFSLGLDWQGLAVAQQEPLLEGRLDDLHVTVSGDYEASNGQVNGKLAADVVLGQLRQGGMVTVGETGLSLHSTVNAQLTPKYAIKGITSDDTLSLRLTNLGYADDALQTRIKELNIFSKTREDVDAQQYWLEELHISSNPLFDLSAKGSFFQKSQAFTAALDLPYLNVGEVLRRVEGSVVAGLQDIQPQGTVALSLQGAGRVPTPGDIEALTIPVDVDVRLSLDQVAGAFDQHQVRGAGGTLAVAFVSGESPQATVKSDVRVETIHLGPGLPVSRILDAVMDIDVASRDFNEVAIDQFHLGMKGADVNLRGAVTGFKKFLAGHMTVPQALGDVFAQVSTKITMQLDEFQTFLKSMGWVGSGGAHVTMAVHKKEQGPLDVQVELGGRDITLSQNGTKIVDLNGAIILRKHLEWDRGAPRSSSRPRPFHPTDVLAQLQSLAGQSRSLTIARLEVGGLTIENFSTNILFHRQDFKIQNLAMNILGGGLGGNIVATTGKAFGVSARLEAAQLDLNHLLADHQQIAGDSLVDATIGVAVFFEPDTGVLDLSRTEINLFITHIGKEALDRVLLFLDPEGSNPTMVNARSQVRLANPSHVTMRLARGMMGFEILFSEGLLSSFKMDRIPVGSISSFQQVTRSIPNWETISRTMDLIGSTSYGVDETGTIVVR